VIDAAGKDVPERWKPGQRVGAGWHAWHCFSCDNCRRGDFFACQTGAQVTGISFDSGYADYLVAPATALARVPAELPAPDAAPRPRGRCRARARQLSRRAATGGPGGATSSGPSPWGGSAPGGPSTRRGWGSAPPRSPGERTKSPSPGSPARPPTSTAGPPPPP